MSVIIPRIYVIGKALNVEYGRNLMIFPERG